LSIVCFFSATEVKEKLKNKMLCSVATNIENDAKECGSAQQNNDQHIYIKNIK